MPTNEGRKQTAEQTLLTKDSHLQVTQSNPLATTMQRVCVIILLAFLMFSIRDCHSQSAVVSVTLQPVSVAEGDPATFVCGFSIKDNSSSFTFHYMVWFHSNNRIAEFFKQMLNPTYTKGISLSEYEVTRNQSCSILRISSPRYSDSGTFKCEVEYINTYGIESSEEQANLTVFVPPRNISLFYSTDAFTPGVAYLTQWKMRQFTCVVHSINPKASFHWTKGNIVLTQERNTHEVDEFGLTTSISTITLLPTWADHGKSLRCFAFNIKDRPGKSANMTLDVKVLPSNSSMSLSDDLGIRIAGATVIMDQCKLHNFSCVVQDTRPAASVHWFLDGEEQVSASQTATGGGDELSTIKSFWSLIPLKKHHYQTLKVEARSADLEDPPPSIEVSLHVNITTLAPKCNITNITSSSAFLECLPDYDSMDITRYHIQYREPGKDTIVISREGIELKYILKNLSSSTTYGIDVYVEDIVGASETVHNRFKTLPKSPGDMGITASFKRSTGVISVTGITAKDWTNSSNHVQVEVLPTNQTHWLKFGGDLREDTDVALKDVRIKYCEGSACSDATSAIVVVDATVTPWLGPFIVAACLSLFLIMVVCYLVYVIKSQQKHLDHVSEVGKSKHEPVTDTHDESGL